MKKILLVSTLIALSNASAQPITQKATNLYQSLIKHLNMQSIKCPGALGGQETVCATSNQDKELTQRKATAWPRWKQTNPWKSNGAGFSTDGKDQYAVSVFNNIGTDAGSLLIFTEFPTRKAVAAPAQPARTFRSCAAARAAGYSNMRRGQPGYSAGLDRDGDGVACDK